MNALVQIEVIDAQSLDIQVQVIEVTSVGIHVDVVVPPDPVTFVEVLIPGFQGPPGPPGQSGGVPEAPIDGKPYARQDAAWTEVTGGGSGGGSVAWDDVVGKPPTFPPTLPIAQVGVTNLITDLDAKAPLASPGLTGAPTAPTAAPGTDTTQIASTAFVKGAVDANVEDWADLTGKPATFPPTLPIPSSGVSGLDAAQSAQDATISGKASTVHTHEQADVIGLDTALAGKADVIHTHNYSSLTGIPSTFAPSPHNHPQSEVTNLVTDLAAKETAANKGIADGYAALDSSGKIPSSQLPSYVDDVQEFANLAAFPATGTVGIIYVALDTNRTYRWSGSVYTEISSSPGSTDAVPEGSVNLYHTTARASAAAPVQSVAAKTGAVTLVKDDVGLDAVDNTSDVNKPVSTATQTALDLKAPLADPIFTGNPQAPTPTAADNDQSIATTAFVNLQGFLKDAPSDGQQYARKDALWSAVDTSGGGTSVTISDDAPASPVVGSLWWESDSGNMFIWYDDGNSTQWVAAHASGGGGVPEAPVDGKPYSRKSAAWAAAWTQLTQAAYDALSPPDPDTLYVVVG